MDKGHIGLLGQRSLLGFYFGKKYLFVIQGGGAGVSFEHSN